MQSDRILFIVTSADHIGEAALPTGSWFEEVAAPYYTFLDAKCDVTIASPLGGLAPLDPTSLKEENLTASTRRFVADAKAQKAIANTLPLAMIDPAAYDAVFFAGGHGTMVDFPIDENIRKIVEHFYAEGKPLASVCHGPACLVSALKPNGAPLIQGHRFTCFTDEEETTVGGHATVPFMLESRLRALGGIAATELPFGPCVIVEGALITGQNPASSIPTAEAVIHQLRHRIATQHAA